MFRERSSPYQLEFFEKGSPYIPERAVDEGEDWRNYRVRGATPELKSQWAKLLEDRPDLLVGLYSVNVGGTREECDAWNNRILELRDEGWVIWHEYGMSMTGLFTELFVFAWHPDGREHPDYTARKRPAETTTLRNLPAWYELAVELGLLGPAV